MKNTANIYCSHCGGNEFQNCSINLFPCGDVENGEEISKMEYGECSNCGHWFRWDNVQCFYNDETGENEYFY